MELNDKKVLLLTGPSGSGKTTIANILMKQYGFKTPVNFSTREPRGDYELDIYVFLTPSQYLTKLAHGDFAGFTAYNGNLYGMGKNFEKDEEGKLKYNYVCILEPSGKVSMEKELLLMDIPYVSMFLEIDEATMEHRLGFLRRESVETIEKRKKDLKYFSPQLVHYDIIEDGRLPTEEIMKTITTLFDLGGEK